MITTECHTAVGPKKIPSHLRKVADQSAAQHLTVTAKCIDGQKEQKASAWKCLGFSDANPQLTAQALTDLRSIRHLFTRTGADSPVCHASFNNHFFHNNLLPSHGPNDSIQTVVLFPFCVWNATFTQLWFTGDRQAKKTATLVTKAQKNEPRIVAENCKLIEAFLYTFMKAN